MSRYNRTSFSAYLEDCDYKGYKTYIWIENMKIRYFYLQTPEDYTETFETLADLYDYIDNKQEVREE
jgi:hypothetical protein